MAETDQLAESQNQIQDTPAQEAPEKVFTQSEVTKLVGRVKLETKEQAYDKARREIMAELQQQQAPQESQMQQPSQAQNVGGMQQMSQDDIRRLIAEETQKHQSEMNTRNQQQAEQNWAKKVTESFINKMSAGKDKYSDFDEKVGSLNLPSIPEIVHLAEGTDNTHDVMYDLAENPHKVGTLLMLAQRNPALAQKEIQKLSASIKNNESAANVKLPKDPLRPLKPSANGMDNGELSVSDLRKMFPG